MKRTKEIAILSIIIVFMLNFFSVVQAHNIELDPDGKIVFSSNIINGSGGIEVDFSEENYNLFYQPIEMSNDEYNAIVACMNEENAKIVAINEEIENLTVELEKLEAEYNNAKAEYDRLVNAGASEEEIETADNKVNEIVGKINTVNEAGQAKVQEGKDVEKEYTVKFNELTPMYKEENWAEVNNGHYQLDLNFSGKKHMVIWAKLVTSTGAIVYDTEIYSFDGSGSGVNGENVTLNKTEITLNVGGTFTLEATITPANASDKTLIWESSNENIATVENGVVTAKGEGDAVITVSMVNGKTATCTVHVKKGDSTGKDDPEDPGKDEPDIPTKDDPTTIPDKKLPQTGEAYIILTAIAVLAIVVVIAHKQHKKNNF